MRSSRIVVWSTAALLAVVLLVLLNCARLDDHSGGSSSGASSIHTVQVQGNELADQGLNGNLVEVVERLDSSEDPVVGPEPEGEPVEPAALRAGDVLRAVEVQRAGGADAFFWAEPIPDEVFARMEGKSFGWDCTVPRDDLRYVRVLHVDAEGTIKVGELVVHRNVADDIIDIFRQLYDAGYPIKKMHLVDDYDASDDASCADDNTACFNFRFVTGGTTLSNHAYGIAIDISPFENPYCIPEQDYVSPTDAWRYADRSLYEPYMIHTDDLCYQLFISHGWEWGGDWPTPKDYQHFEKPSAL